MSPQLRAAFLQVEREYKAVTDAEKAEVQALGGLHVVGSERHESRRIDNQLRGRAGRQGDLGSTRYFLSLEVRRRLGGRWGHAVERAGTTVPCNPPCSYLCFLPSLPPSGPLLY